MAMKALKRTTGNMKLVMLTALYNPLCERTGFGWIWDRARTQTMAAAWASDAISGPVLSGAVSLREITHHLRGGGNNNIGWGALLWQEMVGTDEVRFGKHRELRYLPK